VVTAAVSMSAMSDAGEIYSVCIHRSEKQKEEELQLAGCVIR